MSKETIARWNAIPMQRPEQTAGAKRARDDPSDEETDNISLVSRTPSPVPPSAQEMLRRGIDSYSNGVSIEEEIATLETRIKKTNIGYAMLSKLGWKEGEGLGASGTGRPDPIPFVLKNDQMGLGKASLDSAMIDATVAQRRDLASERQTKETDEKRQKREEAAAKQANIKSEITETLKPFYCRLCDKQYQTVGQYDEHCNSYAHHHMAREKGLKASAKLGTDAAARAMKEKKREERDLRKLAKAAGVKITPSNPPLLPPPQFSLPPGEDAPKKKSGWATVGSSSSSEGTTKPGWAAVGDTSTSRRGWSRLGSTSSSDKPTPPSEPAPPFAPPPEAPPPPLPSSPPPPMPSTNPKPHAPPLFCSAGFTNLTDQLEERAIVDTTEPPTNIENVDHEMQEPGSPKQMAIDVDEMYPPTPGTPVFGRHIPKTPAWRIHEAPSPSPHVGTAIRNGFPGDSASPIGALRGGFRGRGIGRGAAPANSGQPQSQGRSWSPIGDLFSGPPGWSRGN